MEQAKVGTHSVASVPATLRTAGRVKLRAVASSFSWYRYPGESEISRLKRRVSSGASTAVKVSIGR